MNEMMKSYKGKLTDYIKREDAIKALCKSKCIPGVLCPDEYCVEVREVFDDISAVQPEITEEQVREYCRKRCLSVIDGALLTKYVNGCQDTISGIPSAQPERKKGKWTKISPASIYECSVCGQNIMTQDIDAYRYCHGCGAEMEVSE